jgi:hypothetical protein
MSQTNDPKDLHAQLQHLLEVHGADRSRWPAAERLRLAPLIAGDARAKTALSEAQAFDRLLDLAPSVSIERERALARRIATAAAEQALRPASNVVALKLKPASILAAGLRHPAAALLAASLVIGIIVGSSGVTQPAFALIAETVGLSDDEPELAFAGDVLPSGEDAL